MYKQTREEFYLNIAKATAQRSTCLKVKKGCIIVNRENDVITSMGYFASPVNCTECIAIDECIVDNCNNPLYCRSASAIENALLYMNPMEKYCDIFLYTEDAHSGECVYSEPTYEEMKLIVNAHIFNIFIMCPNGEFISKTSEELFNDMIDTMVIV